MLGSMNNFWTVWMQSPSMLKIHYWAIELFILHWTIHYRVRTIRDFVLIEKGVLTEGVGRGTSIRLLMKVPMHVLIQTGKANFAGWVLCVFLQHDSRYQSENWHRWSLGLILLQHYSTKHWLSFRLSNGNYNAL